MKLYGYRGMMTTRDDRLGMRHLTAIASDYSERGRSKATGLLGVRTSYLEQRSAKFSSGQVENTPSERKGE